MAEQGGWNRACDAGGMRDVPDGVFAPEQFGNSSARNKMCPFSHTHRRPLPLFTGLYMQNELMCAETTGVRTLLLYPILESRRRRTIGHVLFAADEIESSIQAPSSTKYPLNTAPQMLIT